jgi:uncharacterized membrane protein
MSESQSVATSPAKRVGVLSTVNAYLTRIPLPAARTVTYASTTLWGIGFAIASAIRYAAFGDRRYDLGNFTQAIWATAHGHVLEVTEVGGLQVSRLGIHVDPIIVLLAPLWRLWPSPVMLLSCQAIALAFGAVPLFWLARKHLARDRDATFIALAYLLCPSVGWNALFEFHAVAFAVPLLLLTVWFLDEERYVAFVIAATGAMLCQEQIGLVIAFLGLWYALSKGRLAIGLRITALGLAVSAIDFGVVLRHYSGGTPYTGRYDAVGGSFGGMARNVFEHPDKFIQALQLTDLLGPIMLAIPVLGLCFRSPILLAALPQALLLTLSGNQADWRYNAQNVLVIIPFVYAGTVLALAKREQRSSKRSPIRAEHVFTLSAVVAVALGPSPVSLPSRDEARLSAERRAVSLVPADARVAATNHLGSHLAARRYTYVFPHIAKAEWIAVDSADPFLPPSDLTNRDGLAVGAHDLYSAPGRLAGAIHVLEHSRQWEQVYSQSTVHVFVRRTRLNGGA